MFILKEKKIQPTFSGDAVHLILNLFFYQVFEQEGVGSPKGARRMCEPQGSAAPVGALSSGSRGDLDQGPTWTRWGPFLNEPQRTETGHTCLCFRNIFIPLKIPISMTFTYVYLCIKRVQ